MPSKRPSATRTASPVLLQTLKAAIAGPRKPGPSSMAAARKGTYRIAGPVWRETALASTVGLCYDRHMTAFEHIPSASGASPLLFLCDHASAALPPDVAGLGLTPELFQTHIAYDIGAAQVTRVRWLAASALRPFWDLGRGF